MQACNAAPSTPLTLNQWVWSTQDEPLLATLRKVQPAAIAGVHVATLRLERGAIAVDLGLSPRAVAGPVALVIRLDDSMHGGWDDDALPAAIDATIARVMAMARSSGAHWAEVQLDYDVPVRLIPAWGSTLARLHAGALQGENLWITSLVSHVAEPGWSAAVGPSVAGHILQMFDTGDKLDDRDAIARLANGAGLPWRLGVGAFERPGTDHRAWLAHAAEVCSPPLCTSVWVFPAGRGYL